MSIMMFTLRAFSASFDLIKHCECTGWCNSGLV